MNTYAPGSEVDLDFTFRDKSGALADPTTATFYVEQADGTVTTYALNQATRLSTGVYELTIVTTNVPGRWYYRGQGTSGLVCSTLDEAFLVEATRFS